MSGSALAERSHPLDCLPDRVASFEPAAANPSSLSGAQWVPGIVLGPPGSSSPVEGSLTVATLGSGGRAVLAFDDIVIEDRPGPDFIVFENAFFKLPVPAGPADPFQVFVEPGFVEASADGELWFPFRYEGNALATADALPAGSAVGPPLWFDLAGLAGRTPTFTGNWTVADDPEVYDPSGAGGVSGAGGDAFDLAHAGLSEARFVRITDAGVDLGFVGSGLGFDLGAVVVLHGRPHAPATADTDGDRLSDAEEERVYGSAPWLADTDGDGTNDGDEVASCRDPASLATSPALHAEPRLWLRGAACTELRWTFMGSGHVYDVVRGELEALAGGADVVDLGAVACLVDDDTDVRHACDAAPLESGSGFFYLVRVEGSTSYGRSSALEPRVATGGCP
jgi:hypothetical protein